MGIYRKFLQNPSALTSMKFEYWKLTDYPGIMILQKKGSDIYKWILIKLNCTYKCHCHLVPSMVGSFNRFSVNDYLAQKLMSICVFFQPCENLWAENK